MTHEPGCNNLDQLIDLTNTEGVKTFPVMRTNTLTMIGWREWIRLDALGLDTIKAKVDTGARTSALHAFEINPFEEAGKTRVEFKIHPEQRTNQKVTVCTADVLDQREVTDSGGHTENRWVISSEVSLGEHTWPIELTLTSRDNMLFRMLLGRTAMAGRFQVDPSQSYLLGKRPKKQKLKVK